MSVPSYFDPCLPVIGRAPLLANRIWLPCRSFVSIGTSAQERGGGTSDLGRLQAQLSAQLGSRIEHRKSGEQVDMPLSDRQPLFKPADAEISTAFTPQSVPKANTMD